MKSILPIVIAILFPSFASAINEDYRKYNQEIIQCEAHFLFHDDIPKALKSYRAVVGNYSRPYAKDCFVALQLACATDDTATATFFFRKAFERGVEFTAILEAKPIIDFFWRHKDYSYGLKETYEVCHKQFMKGIDLQLRRTVIAMKNRDDSFKMATNGRRRNAGSEMAYQTVIDSNTLNIIRLTKQYGFLGDNLIGFMDYSVDNSEKQRHEFCYSLRSLIDQLYFHHGCCYFMLENEMTAALNAGEISPAMYAAIYEWAYHDREQKRPEMASCNNQGKKQQKIYNFCPIIPPWERSTDTVLVDRCRAEIGLCTLTHAARKRAYEKATGIKLLFGMFNIY